MPGGQVSRLNTELLQLVVPDVGDRVPDPADAQVLRYRPVDDPLNQRRCEMCQTKDAADVALIKAENLGQFLDVPDLPLVDVALPFAAAGNRH